eukprot:7139690-Karenia_brevis.AAC.1
MEKELHCFPLVDKCCYRSIVCEECQHPPCAASGAKIMGLPQAKAKHANTVQLVVDDGRISTQL